MIIVRIWFQVFHIALRRVERYTKVEKRVLIFVLYIHKKGRNATAKFQRIRLQRFREIHFLNLHRLPPAVQDQQ